MSFYAVLTGRKPGLFLSWDECKEQVHKFPSAKYKRFSTQAEACSYLGIPCEEKKQTKRKQIAVEDSKEEDKATQVNVKGNKQIIVFSDGSAQFNPHGPAGTGALILFPDGRKIQCGMHIPHATNNIAELEAIHQALVLVKTYAQEHELKQPILVYTDSKYAIGVLNGTMNVRANQELIERITSIRLPVQYCWVKGHNGNDGNEAVNALAQACCNVENFKV